jgi:hypothetical protein
LRHCLLVLALVITLDQVELKNAKGEWVSVVRPDKIVDLSKEEPAVRFFNNGRIPAGAYSNVRVHFTENGKRWTLERAADYEPALPIKKGTFVGVSFAFEPPSPETVSGDAIKEVTLTVDQQQRVDGSDNIKIWS